MPARSPVRRHIVSTIAGRAKQNPDDPELPALRAELAVEGLAEHIERVVAAAGPLSPEDADRLRSLLPAPAGRDAT